MKKTLVGIASVGLSVVASSPETSGSASSNNTSIPNALTCQKPYKTAN
ncbi:hypothetical protein [Hwangdonia lutea]|uniref:Uncharacterized protein n=1 Tax=Hwangdonia lutea TaxID=3075823 RepID=A0AA97ELA2_9FLAO|nr:hypothetical protein [Hwangdonia sp. SCSIO 19198]WOD42098.1 hypothetical protein RNZ46_08810 [Hwangdonia sp. SCSIO 19198]